jgi:hypothetical protein
VGATHVKQIASYARGCTGNGLPDPGSILVRNQVRPGSYLTLVGSRKSRPAPRTSLGALPSAGPSTPSTAPTAPGTIALPGLPGGEQGRSDKREQIPIPLPD